jgi:hypothetical protein
MEHLEIKPAVDFKQYGKLPLTEVLSPKRQERDSSGLDVLLDSKKNAQDQAKPPLGIETGMVYIAVPVSIVAWIGIIYLVKIMFF